LKTPKHTFALIQDNYAYAQRGVKYYIEKHNQ